MLGRKIAVVLTLTLVAGAAAGVAAGAVTLPGTGSPTASAQVATPNATAGPATYGSSVGFNGQQIMWDSPTELAHELDAIAATGARWLRADFPWSGLAAAGRGRYNWAPADHLVAAANARGIHLLAMVGYTPSWDRPRGTTDHYQPTDPAPFAEFVRAAAQRYAPQGVHAWEIWNEPNMRDFWQPAPNVARYTQLLKLGSAAIHAVDPSATVVSGGVAPAADRAGYSIATNAFVAGIYANGGGPSLQAVGIHPYSFPYPPMYPGDWNPFYMTPETHSIMAAHGDGGKEIWATEIGWPTGTARDAVSESTQASMVSQSLTAWTKYPYAGNLFWFNWRDESPNRGDLFKNMGVLRYDNSAKPALGVFRSMLHGARPNGGGTADGPWLVGADARLFSTGGHSAPSIARVRLNRSITGAARTPDSRGVWMVASDGGIFAFGNAGYYGSTGAVRLNRPIVGMAPTRSGHGYWLVASDGGVFSFGDAKFYGSTGTVRLNRPIVGVAATPSGHGYWLVASDGGVFSFGDAKFYGSTGNLKLNRPIVGIAHSTTGHGYWMVASDGGIFTFGDARYYGSTGGTYLSASITGIAVTKTGHGYWLPEADGTVHSFGDAGYATPVGGETIVDAITP